MKKITLMLTAMLLSLSTAVMAQTNVPPGNGDGITVDPTFVPVYLYAYFTEPFTEPLLINPENAPVTYTSTNPDVATVDPVTGKVTMVNGGVTTINAKFPDGVYSKNNVWYQLTIIGGQAQPANPTLLDPGLLFRPTSTYGTIGERFTEPTLTNPHGLNVTYTSSNTSIATVDAQTGKITLIRPGNVLITASFGGNSTYKPGSATYALTVLNPGVILPINDELTFIPVVTYATLGKKWEIPVLLGAKKYPVFYISSDTDVATVNTVTGEVTLKAPGTTHIIAVFIGDATHRATSVNYELTVREPITGDPNDLAVEVTKAEAEVGQPFTAPTVTNPHNLDLTYTSSNEEVATVDAKTGAVTIVGSGEATITIAFAGNAEYQGGSVSYTISVAPATGISTVGAEKGATVRYNVGGQRVDNGYRGVVIEKGKKHIAK